MTHFGSDFEVSREPDQLDARSQSLSAVLGFLSIPTNGILSTWFNNLFPDYHVDQSLGQLLHLPNVKLLLCHQLVNHLKDEPGRGPRWRCITPSQWSTRSGLERGCWKSMDMKRKLAL